MAQYFETEVSYQKEDETGALKPVKDLYLVDALSYTEAEARITKEVENTRGGFKLKITKKNITEVFENQLREDTYWLAKVDYISFDERSLKEKKTTHKMLVQGDQLASAFVALKNKLGSLNDYEITCFSKTAILEVFHYKSELLSE